MNQVIKFSASWCGPCKVMKPHFEKFKSEYEGEVEVVDVDVDEDPETAQNFNVRNIPTTLFVKDGEVIHKAVGVLTYDKLKSEVENIF